MVVVLFLLIVLVVTIVPVDSHWEVRTSQTQRMMIQLLGAACVLTVLITGLYFITNSGSNYAASLNSNIKTPFIFSKAFQIHPPNKITSIPWSTSPACAINSDKFYWASQNDQRDTVEQTVVVELHAVQFDCRGGWPVSTAAEARMEYKRKGRH